MTEQSTWAINVVNTNKQIEETVLRRLDLLAELTENAVECSYSPIRARWLAIARTHIEEGFMAMNRAVFKPERVKL